MDQEDLTHRTWDNLSYLLCNRTTTTHTIKHVSTPSCHTQHPRLLHPLSKAPHPSLVVGRGFVLCINGQHLLHELVSLVLQPLPHSDLTSVETLPICAVNGLRRWRPTEQGKGSVNTLQHTHTHTYVQRYVRTYTNTHTHTFTMCIKKDLCATLHELTTYVHTYVCTTVFTYTT